MQTCEHENQEDHELRTPKEPDKPCPVCQGAGLVREWSTVMAIIAIFGFGSGFYMLYRHFTEGPVQQLKIALTVLFGLGIFGLYPLLDRGDCKNCSGMGQLESDGDPDEEDAEWATCDPPE